MCFWSKPCSLSGLTRIPAALTWKSSLVTSRIDQLLFAVLVLMLASIAVQAWCFSVVRRCFAQLRRHSVEKSAAGDRLSHSLTTIPMRAVGREESKTRV